MFKIECENEIWEYAFIKSDSALSEEGRQDFIREAIYAHRKGQRTRTIKGVGFEGHLKRGESFVIGGIGGQHYEAKIETNKGKRNISVLVNELLEIDRN